MTRQALIRSVRSALPSSTPAYRSLSTTTIRMAEGDTGGVRSGGTSQGDAFTKREQASEDYFVKVKEMEKLQQLKEKIQEHKKHLDQLDKNVDETMAQGKK